MDNAKTFLQLRNKYKQNSVEDTRLTKAADLAAQQHLLLTSDVPDAWKRPQLKSMGRQLGHWTTKYPSLLVPRSVGWVERVPLRPRQERMILMPDPCKLG